MNVAIVVGSIRKESYNRKLAEYLKQRYSDQIAFDIVDLRDLPFYDQDTELDPPAAVKEFKERIAASDAVLWITPEYNYSIPGVLKNALDWLSRVDKVMNGKPSWIMGASMGQLGTVRITSPLLPNNEVYIGAVHEKMDESGKLIHEPPIGFIDIVVNNFMTWMNARK